MNWIFLIFFLPLCIWAGSTIGLWLSKLYGSKYDVYRNGYIDGFADGIKHVDEMRIKQGGTHE